MKNEIAKNVIIESPFKGCDNTESGQHILYVNMVARKMLLEGKNVPLFFHTLYTQCLDDSSMEEREIGIKASLNFHNLVEKHVIAIDRGISDGMIYGVKAAIERGSDIEFLTLCDESSVEAKIIKQINDIENIEERWNVGLKTINSLKKDNWGDVSGYRLTSHTLMVDTKNTLMGIADRIDCIQ
ncbi:hypothetical protein [Photobacterium kishitanii]|uniref:DUF7768 domain-containing protein n=1 Tax=Photobacterium kishitanii TaxID=318456 RepID=A0A2T3KMK0_9GAMM|nr:hypothetical protein [Photobacterium kishitanii]PSV00975.1 hypothetical protein C9J27_02820 [Photobacterium kishitanii]